VVYVAVDWNRPDPFTGWGSEGDAGAAGELIGTYTRDGRRWRWRRVVAVEVRF
jgi:hypothetical protein